MMVNLSTTLLTQTELMCVNKLTNAQKMFNEALFMHFDF